MRGHRQAQGPVGWARSGRSDRWLSGRRGEGPRLRPARPLPPTRQGRSTDGGAGPAVRGSTARGARSAPERRPRSLLPRSRRRSRASCCSGRCSTVSTFVAHRGFRGSPSALRPARMRRRRWPTPSVPRGHQRRASRARPGWAEATGIWLRRCGSSAFRRWPGPATNATPLLRVSQARIISHTPPKRST